MQIKKERQTGVTDKWIVQDEENIFFEDINEYDKYVNELENMKDK